MYRLFLEKSEAALNIVLGSALGAYLGVALSMSPDSIDPLRLSVFLLLVYFYVRSLLSLQHYARERYWRPFIFIGILTAGLLWISYRSAGGMPLDEKVYLAISGLWLFSVIFETGQSLILDRAVPRKSA